MADRPDVIHIAGEVVQVGAQLRQRCSWCGAVIEDYDLTRVGFQTPNEQDSEPGPPMWPVGGLVAVAGGMKWTVTHTNDDPLPAEACGQLPHEITGHTSEEAHRG